MTDMVKLGDVLQPVKSARAGDSEYPLLSMTMRNGLVDQFDKFNKRVASQDTSAYKVIERGQLVVGFPIDEGVLDFQTMYDEAIVSPAYGVWELSGKYEVSREYLGAYLRSDHAIAYYKAKLQGSTARRRSLPNSTFLALPIYLPPLDEQRRIVEILDRVDAIRTKRRRMLADFDELKDSMFTEMFGGIQDHTSLGDLIVDGPTNGLYRSQSDYGSGTCILRIDGFYDGVVIPQKWKRVDIPNSEVQRYELREDDIVINRVNSLQYLGKSAIIPALQEPAVYESNMMRFRVDTAETLPLYVVSWLQTEDARIQIVGCAKQAVNQSSINQKDVTSFRIPLPPLPLQREFARRVEAIVAARAKVERALALDDELFASLQSRAFRGEL